MVVLGLIPARGGSKGIPGKNLAPLGGRPLIAWTAAAAKAARRLARVVVSTDDDAIAEAARAEGLEVPFRRPAELAGDETGALPVIRHALGWARGEGLEVEAVAYLQPTSPFRGAEAIDRAVALLEDSGADSVVSVVEVPHGMTPAKLMRRDADGGLSFLDPDPARLSRHGQEHLYARNGPAVLVTRASVLEADSLYGTRILPLVMSKLGSIDIDDAEDLALAEVIARGLAAAPPTPA